LFWLPSLIREANLRRQLGPTPPALVATATAEAAQASGTGPAGPLWLLAGDTRRRELAELPTTAAGPTARRFPLNLDALADQPEEAA
jgi:hypothetical protein